MPRFCQSSREFLLFITAYVDFRSKMYYCPERFNLGRKKIEVIVKGGIIHEEFAKSA